MTNQPPSILSTDSQTPKPSTTAAPIDIFGIISLWRSLHGYYKGDYDLYRHFCSRKLQQLRKALPLTSRIKILSPKGKPHAPISTKKNKRNVRAVLKVKLKTLPLTSDDVPVLKLLKYCLLLSERSTTAISASEKHIHELHRQLNSHGKKYMLSKLRRAINGFEDFVTNTRLISYEVHPSTLILVKSLLCGLRGRYFYLKGLPEDALEQFIEGILLTRTEAVNSFLKRNNTEDHCEFSLKKYHDSLVQWKFTVMDEKEISPASLQSITQTVLGKLSEYGLKEDFFVAASGEMSIPICDKLTIVVREEPIILKLEELNTIAMQGAPEENDEIINNLIYLKADIEAFISSCGLRHTSLQKVVAVLEFSYESQLLLRLIKDLDHMIRFELDEFVTEVCKQMIFLADKNDSNLDRLARFRPELGFKLVIDCIEILNRMIPCTFSHFNKSLAEVKNIILNCKSIYSTILLLFGFQWDQAYTLARLASQRESSFSTIEHPKVVYTPLIPFNDLTVKLNCWEPIIKLQASRLEAVCLTLCRLTEMGLENTSHNNGTIPLRAFPPKPALIPPNPVMYNLVDAVLNEHLLQQLVRSNPTSTCNTSDHSGSLLKRISSLWKR